MFDFYKWCENKNLTLPTTNEHSARIGVKPQYPDAYARSQYPDGYFAPITSTAFLNLKQAKKLKHTK